jgi:rhamnosyl/mannosyltransferase
MESALRQACRHLSRGGHQVLAVVSAGRWRGSAEVADGGTVWRMGEWGAFRSTPLCPGLLPTLWRARHRFQPDVVHLHIPNPALATAWLWLGAGVPLVVSYHSDIVRQRHLAKLWAPLQALLLRRAARIVVTSEALRDQSPILAPHRDRCAVIPLGVDVDRLRAAPAAEVQSWSARLGERFLLFVGRLVYYKGLDVLLEAMVENDLRLVVVGDGPMRARWEARAAELGVAERVRFLGAPDDQELRAIYHASTALVLPSTAPSETFGLVQLEAMACGKPVIAARASGGVASVHVEGETGLLVPPGDAPALRAALLRVWTDPQCAGALGAAGRARVEALFHGARMAERLEAVLKSAAASRRAPQGAS